MSGGPLWTLPEDGIIAARSKAGRLGFAINDAQMTEIIAAAISHITVVERDAKPIPPEVHNLVPFVAMMNNNMMALGRDFYRSGLRGRLRWLFLGKTS